MEFQTGENVQPLRVPSPPMTKEGIQADVARLDEELAEIQDKLALWKDELTQYIESDSAARSAAAIAKKVEAEKLLREVVEIEEEIFILLDELDTVNRVSENKVSKLPTKAEWAPFLNRKATAIDPLLVRLEGKEGEGGRLQKWREMPIQ